jgi:hypothetical protein
LGEIIINFTFISKAFTFLPSESKFFHFYIYNYIMYFIRRFSINLMSLKNETAQDHAPAEAGSAQVQPTDSIGAGSTLTSLSVRVVETIRKIRLTID